MFSQVRSLGDHFADNNLRGFDFQLLSQQLCWPGWPSCTILVKTAGSALSIFSSAPSNFSWPQLFPLNICASPPSVEVHPHFCSGCMCVRRALSTITGRFLGKSRAMLTWAVGVYIGSYGINYKSFFKGLYRTRLKDICRTIITEGQYRSTLT